MYEHCRQPLIPAKHFLARVLNNFLIALAFIVFSLILGAVGYHYSENMPWIDSILNAAMILSGMGPVDALKYSNGKLFATFYCLYSGIAFITVATLLLAPFVHRFLHRFHLGEDAKQD